LKKTFHKHKKAFAVFGILCSSAGVAIASCGGTEGIVSSAAVSMAALLIGDLQKTAATLIATDDAQTEAIISSLKVLTQQVNSSSDKSAAMAVQSEQAVAAVQKDIADQEIANKIVSDFTSQGFDPCGQSVITKKLATTETQTRSSIISRVNSEIEAGGGRYASPADTVVARERRHRDLFCTQSEVDAGICSSVGKLPGGDANAALLFGTDTSDEAVSAKNALINNIVGVPDAPLPPGVASSPAAQAYMMEKKKKDAFLAWPAYSLKTIQTENEMYKATMDERIGQYFGTPRATEWAKDQTTQASRGIMVDLLKIEGLTLKVRERKINANLRLEANLAALLELENQRINTPITQAAAAQAVTASAAAKVK
jgi:hypothetical protein